MSEFKQLGEECTKCKNKRLCEECDIREERERIIIEVIENHIKTYGYSPSINYIAKEIGVCKSNAHTMLKRMAEKGHITYGNYKHGIIRVL